MQSTGSSVLFFDCNFHPVDEDENSVENHICAHCPSGGCREMHVNAMRESSDKGKPVIYRCKVSLIFWTCPIYRDGCFFGALRGSGFMNEGKNPPKQKIIGGSITTREFAKRLSRFPKADSEKINSMAELLLLCAESFSSGSDHRQLRLRSEQQENLSSLLRELKEKYPEKSELPAYPLKKERQLVASISRGDTAGAKKLLNEIFAILLFNSKDQFKYLQLKSLELAVLFSRAEISSGGGYTAEYNIRCFKQIQDAKTAEELSCILHDLAEDITGRIISFQGIPHASAMRKAELYIRENLKRKMSLNEIARVAGLSAPYFSSIFKSEMGENLSVYINRLRVEKASKLLKETSMPLSEISGECCFEDQSWFSRIFKAYTGISPGKYRSQFAASA